MRAFWGFVLAIVWKDISLELRTREITLSLLVFTVLVGLIFSFAMGDKPEVLVQVAPGVLWASFVFAEMLALNRTLVTEIDKGILVGLMLTPTGWDAIYFGKVLGVLVFMLVVEIIMFPIFALLFGLPLFQPRLLLVAFPATLGFAAVGIMLSTMVANTRSREVMLPVLFLPVVLPLVIAAVQATRGILQGVALGEIVHWIQLMGVFDILFLVVASLLFEHVLET